MVVSAEMVRLIREHDELLAALKGLLCGLNQTNIECGGYQAAELKGAVAHALSVIARVEAE